MDHGTVGLRVGRRKYLGFGEGREKLLGLDLGVGIRRRLIRF